MIDRISMPVSNYRFLLASLGCAVMASLLFLLGLHGGFVFDDGSNIVQNSAIQLDSLSLNSLLRVLFSPQPGGITRILPTLSFALDYWRGNGLDPAIFKATNIAFHALTTCVLAWFFRRVLIAANTTPSQAGVMAIVLALAWAVHPLQVSSVLYVVQRMQTMCTLFLLLALLSYLSARQAQIAGESGRTGLMLTVLFWTLAFGCKEDAILLPAYTLALELTVLRFRAANARLARFVCKSYLIAITVGAILYLFVAIPHYWTWGNYEGRDFSSYERLLTQSRVLCMYLWEILIPLPSHMPFYYDWFQPSHGLLQPWTTLPAILSVTILLAIAWHMRIRRPLFSLGVFIYFAGHFITSNVAGLELAFEHRNHFPMIGVILAVGDILTLVDQHLRIRPTITMTFGTILLMLLGGATVSRAMTWNSPLRLAQDSIEFAPHSARAWNSLCLYYYELGGGKNPKNPYLDKAIDICGKGAAAAPYSITSQTNLVVFKTMRGSVTQADWDSLLERLRRVNLGPENMGTASVLMNNVNLGVDLDETGVLKAIEIVSQRTSLGPNESASIGNFILTQTHQPERSYPYFERSVKLFSSYSPKSAEAVIDNLRSQGHEEWANKLETLAQRESKPQDPH